MKREELTRCNLAQLKSACDRKGLSSSGDKTQLVDRLAGGRRQPARVKKSPRKPVRGVEAQMSRASFRQIAGETVRYFEDRLAKRDAVGEALRTAMDGTVLYTPEQELSPVCVPTDTETQRVETQYEVSNEKCLSAAKRLVEEGFDNPAVLVFASAKNPGGGFLRGANAQEESICRCSALYPCIENSEMYVFNNANTTKDCLYSNYMTYAPGVPVIRDDNDEREIRDDFYTASFITAPAPNAGVARRRGTTEREIENVMRTRIRRVLCVANMQGHLALVLGAFGCGVFGNNPNMVARLFHTALEGEFKGCFARVRFAVLDRVNGVNIRAFENQFGPLQNQGSN